MVLCAPALAANSPHHGYLGANVGDVPASQSKLNLDWRVHWPRMPQPWDKPEPAAVQVPKVLSQDEKKVQRVKPNDDHWRPTMPIAYTAEHFAEDLSEALSPESGDDDSRGVMDAVPGLRGSA